MSRISNSFSAAEIALQQQINRKLLADPNYRVLMQAPAAPGLLRKWQSMEDRAREDELRALNVNKESLPGAAE